MDWLRIERIAPPFEFGWGHTVVETSLHGAVAWAKRKGSDAFGLWLFDRKLGWTDLEPKGRLFAPYCDCNGMVYDSKRDRMILSGVGGAYQKPSNGTFLAFDFKTRSITAITPASATLAKTGKLYTRVYDCAQNRMFLLDAGGFESFRDPHEVTYSTGWMYDARRKLAYAFSFRGEARAIRVNPQTAKREADAGPPP